METIQIFTTGGTIDKIYFDKKNTYEVGEPQIAEVLRQADVTCPYIITSLLRKDSLDMTDDERQLIRKAVESCPHRRILITHGTDTMALTAGVLRGVADKTIVLTGSMQPALFRVTDAVFNIGCAFIAVQILPPGVYITMNGRIFHAGRVRKNVAENRFEEIEGGAAESRDK
jgi:L-asparaginase